MKKLFSMLLMVLLVGTFTTSIVLADSIEGAPEDGDKIVTIATGLSEEQKANILVEFGVIEEYTVREGEFVYEIPEDIIVIDVDISEEREYLGDYISADKIGNKSMSSSFMLIKEDGFGINLDLNNITWVDETMYKNALITAGVTNVDVKVSSPMGVSGTGALTGMIKAYDEYEDIEISEEQKQVSNEEMVLTSSLGDELGKEEANELMIRLKDLIANNSFDSIEELRAAIEEVIADMGLTISEETLDKLVGLLDKLSNLDIDWSKFEDQINNLKEDALGIISDVQESGALETIWEAVISFFQSIGDFFAGLFGGNE